jgi:hypothetical protein
MSGVALAMTLIGVPLVSIGGAAILVLVKKV